MRLLSISSLCAITVLASSCIFLNRGGERGKALDKWETTNQTFSIRVTEYEEKNPVWLTHFFYVFESSLAGSNDWHEVTAVRTGDDIPIPYGQIRFVSNEVGYFFMNQQYVITTNAGRTWSIWDAKRDLPDLQNSYVFIEEVKIEADGTGTMTLKPINEQHSAVPNLKTSDYGQHWGIN